MTIRPQDLGGRRGFGPVPVERDEPVWHAPWEAAVVAGILTTIGAGLYNVDQFREAIDDLDPLSYVSVGYYRRWLHTLEANCVRAGVFTEEDVERRMEEVASGAPLPAPRDPGVTERLRRLVYDGAPGGRDPGSAPRFAPGERVRGRVLPGERHSRIPVYAQGREGVVERVQGGFAFPDTNRRGEGEQPQHVYSVRFDARDLWPDAEEQTTVLLDLWEGYLEAAERSAA